MTELNINPSIIMPQVIGLVVTNYQKVNICPVNWQVISTKYESHMTVCVGLSQGHFSLKAIRETKEFVYALPHRKQLKDALYCGTVSGKDVDKKEKTSFEFVPSDTIATPYIKDAVLNTECKLHTIVEMENYAIVIGLITAVHESEFGALDKIYAIGGQKYGIIEQVKALQDGRL